MHLEAISNDSIEKDFAERKQISTNLQKTTIYNKKSKRMKLKGILLQTLALEVGNWEQGTPR